MNPRSIHASEDGAGAGAQGAEKNGQQQQQQMEEQQRQRRQLLLQQQQQQAPSPEASATEFQGFPSGGLQADTQPGLVGCNTQELSFCSPVREVHGVT
ncbi:hypothetical protein DUNSADRAFT_12681 [Dunaliella salina]|uniref:Uncharacterized protein n=1 Tax=Dunaliella salina TaxID=3046 RepID=A0ABQ7GAU9_DUNSA|nr:hypothetical protein DUNSADRAFT_12681 [Dunaliella salina]|eukprot:KAF5831734.1 hypothetical protein DUNSADRAFT_12681 [Dunaliella salina]